LGEMNERLLNTILSNEKNLERILDNLKDGIIAHDLNRRITYYNKKAEEITGYRKKEVLGKDCHKIHGRPFCGNRCSFLYSDPPDTSLQDFLEYPIDIITKDGEFRRVEMSVTLMKDENGNYFGVLAAFRDVTEMLNLQLKLGEVTSFSNIIGRDSKMLHVFSKSGMSPYMILRFISMERPEQAKSLSPMPSTMQATGPERLLFPSTVAPCRKIL